MFDFDYTWIRRPFDGCSTAHRYSRKARNHANLFIYFALSTVAEIGRPAVAT